MTGTGTGQTVWRTAFEGEDAYRVQSGRGAAVTVLPRRGAKIVSLVGPTGREWLTQHIGEFLPDGAGLPFTDAEMCGWDECLPTIDADVLADGVPLSDHGDAWDRPWRAQIVGDELVTSVEGRDWPYSFSRRIGAQGHDLVLRYEVKNDDGVARPFLWAAHPQLWAHERSTIRILPDVERVWDVSAAADIVWLGSTTARVPTQTRARKLWSLPDDRPTGLELFHPDGAALTLEWSAPVPMYAGIWVDGGAFARERVVALEPATGWFDSAVRAAESGHCLMLAAGESVAWELRVRVTH